MDRQTRIKMILSAVSVAVGASALTLLGRNSDMPSLWLLAVLGSVYAYLEFRSVRVGERLALSPSVMALFAAAVIFGPEAGFGAVLIAAAGTPSARDFRERRWFEPAANFGQLVLSATVGVTVLGILSPPEITVGGLWRVAVASSIAALVYDLVNLTLVGSMVRIAFGVDIWTDIDVREVVAPFLAMGFLGGLLGAAYRLVGPATLPLIVIGLLVAHFALRSYGRQHAAHDSILRAFARALEAKDIYSRGRSGQVEHFADLAAGPAGIRLHRRERIHTAALLREVTKLAVSHEIYRKQGPLLPTEMEYLRTQMNRVAGLLREVDILRPAIDLVGTDGPGTGPARESERIDAAILAVAVAFEAMTSARSYRPAMTQREAIAELRAHRGSQFDPVAVDAFLEGLAASGEIFGAPESVPEQSGIRRD